MGFLPGMQGWFNLYKSMNAMHHINKQKITLKTQHPFVMKTLNHMSIEGKCFNTIKSTCDQPSADILKLFLCYQDKTGCPLSLLLVNIVPEVLASTIGQ